MADQTWQFREFAAPDGEQAAVSFLNEPLRQGRGEASATLRNDGTAGCSAGAWQPGRGPGADLAVPGVRGSGRGAGRGEFPE